jgi:hypothetical protein
MGGEYYSMFVDQLKDFVGRGYWQRVRSDFRRQLTTNQVLTPQTTKKIMILIRSTVLMGPKFPRLSPEVRNRKRRDKCQKIRADSEPP